MTSEDMERAIQFVLEQQAQLSATVDRLSVKVDRNADSVTALLAITEIQSQEIRELGEGMRELGGAVRTVDGRQREADERQRQSDERQRQADERQRQADERQRQADERQRQADERQREADERGRQTDERLNALINTVERMISERKNGKSEPPSPDA